MRDVKRTKTRFLAFPENVEAGRSKSMTTSERDNWLININNSAAAVVSQLGSAAVEAVFRRYGIACAEEADDCDLAEIFGKLYALEAESR